jgi:nitrile hydratase subunit beta
VSLAPGQRVETRLRARPGHTRLPLYARGRTGTVAAYRGSFRLPDDLVRHGDAEPRSLYSVRFDSRDLWGADAEAHDVYLDLFEDYLRPAEQRSEP